MGCHADSYEQARWFGDDISLRADVYTNELIGLNKTRFAMRHVGAGDPPASRARTALGFLVSGREAIETMHGTHCLIAGELAGLGLGEPVREALLQMFERALTPVERERVRLHPYLTERIMCASSVLASLGALAAQHHERLDGSGYPRGLTAG